MIAMISSVSAVLANSFGTRLRPRSLISFARWLGRWAAQLGRLAQPGTLRRLLIAPHPARVAAIVLASFAAGVIWIVAAGHPYPFPHSR
jgi:hypothetical protein